MPKILDFGAVLLPEVVLKQVQSDFQNYADTRKSILELSHCDAHVLSMMARAESDLRQLLDVPDSHDILFCQGYATTQFAAVPFNLIGDFANMMPPVYLVTGTASEAAFKESGKHIGSKRVSSLDELIPYCSYPRPYVYYCDNETVNGIEFDAAALPAFRLACLKRTPVVCDMSSNFLSRPVDVQCFDVIFAEAQKISGIAGSTIVIVRKSLLNRANRATPTALSWKVASTAKSSHDNPPVFAIYMLGLMFAWTLAQGGVEEMARRSEAKSQCLYQAIDASAIFRSLVPKERRSRMNVVFGIYEPGDLDSDAPYYLDPELGFGGPQTSLRKPSVNDLRPYSNHSSADDDYDCPNSDSDSDASEDHPYRSSGHVGPHFSDGECPSCSMKQKYINASSNNSLENQFQLESDLIGLIGLKGRRAVGGFSVSLNNAMSIDGVQALIQFMHRFEEKIISKETK